MSNNWNAILAETEEGVRPLLREFVEEVTAEVGPNVKQYAAEVAKDAARLLVKNAGQDDETVARDLRHLRVTLGNLAIEKGLVLQRHALDKLDKTLSIVLRVALKALKIALV